MSQTSDPVIFQVRESRRGKQIGHARLNAPEQLNALNLTMIQMLLEQPQMWEQDEHCLCFLDSGVKKAVCRRRYSSFVPRLNQIDETRDRASYHVFFKRV